VAEEERGVNVTLELLDPEGNGPERDPVSGLGPEAHAAYSAWLREHGVATVPARHPRFAIVEQLDRIEERIEDAEWALGRVAPNSPNGKPLRRRLAVLERQAATLWAELNELDQLMADWRHYCRNPECRQLLSAEQAATASLCPECLSAYSTTHSSDRTV
jgi:hypothetical protein